MSASRDLVDWTADFRQALRDATLRPTRAAAAAWTPPMDVIERPDGLEVVFDLAGVRGGVRALVKSGTLVIMGEKRSPTGHCADGAAFHVAERTCGPFIRTVPLRLPFEASAIRATLANGELRILVPRIEDRRGREIDIPIEIL